MWHNNNIISLKWYSSVLHICSISQYHRMCFVVSRARESIPYWRLYRFGQQYDIFRIPVYRFGFTTIFYICIYICMYVCMYVCVCVCIIINIKVYHKTFPQFRTKYSWFQTLVSIKSKKKHNIKNRKLKSYLQSVLCGGPIH